MARPEITGRKNGAISARPDANRNRGPPDDVDLDLDAYSIGQFCQRHGLSIATFYKLKDQMPPTFRVGKRVLIGREAAAAWRRQRETAA